MTMKTVLRSIAGVALLTVVALMNTGCSWCIDCDNDSIAPAPKPQPKAVVRRSKGACPRVVQQGDMLSSQMAVPTGDVSTSVLLLERQAPVEVALGKEYKYALRVTNLTDCPVDDVVVTDRLTAGDFSFSQSEPKAEMLPNGKAKWDLGTIGGKDSKMIWIKGKANKTGDVSHCYQVTYLRNLCQTVKVIEPALELVKSAPREVTICDRIPMRLVVSNPGTGAVKNVVVTDNLPAGLTTVDGKETVTFDAGTLASGQSKEFTLVAKAQKTGTFKNTASATGAGGLSAQASASTTVRKAVLNISCDATEKVFVGRPAKYTVKVCNTGDTAAKNVILTDTLPGQVSFVSASAGGQVTGNKVVWNLGSIEPKGCKEVTVNVKANTIGMARNAAVAQATCAAPVNTACATKIDGIPAILLEVVDDPDPIEVGGQTVYTITATNQGSAPGTGIHIKCTLEDAQTYVRSSGSTQAKVAGKVVDFAPVATLAPKAKATWQVVVKAAKTGDIRFAVEMNSDQITRPVNETEATNQY